MKVIAHRGYWESIDQQNTIEAILLGLVVCDGVEIDLRLHQGQIVVSHDPVTPNLSPLSFEEALRLHAHFPGKCWALNIKEDGMTEHLASLLSRAPGLNYFCFDMSFPETVQFIRRGLLVGCRVSDRERENTWLSERSSFYVLDGFEALPELSFTRNLPTLVISPELHGRSCVSQELSDRFDADRFWLCTDHVLDLIE